MLMDIHTSRETYCPEKVKNIDENGSFNSFSEIIKIKRRYKYWRVLLKNQFS